MSSTLAHSTGVKILVYSQAGMGKTVLTATAPKPLLISAESGLLSLTPQNIARLYGENTPGITYDIPCIEIKSLLDLTQAYNWILQNRGSGHFETICLDSITEIAEVLLANLKANAKDARMAYGDLLDQMMKVIRNFRDLPDLNVYMSCQMERYKDEATGNFIFGPSLPGNKLGQKLPFIFDEVFRLTTIVDGKGETSRMLQTQPTYQYDAKDRSGSLAPNEFPNLTYIIDKIRGN